MTSAYRSFRLILGAGVALSSLSLVACGAEFKADTTGGLGGVGGSGGDASSSGGASDGGQGSGSGGTAASGGRGSGGTVGDGGVTSSGGFVSSGGVNAGGMTGTGSGTSAGGASNAGGGVSSGGVTSAGGGTSTGGTTIQCTPGSVLCDKVPALRCNDLGVWVPSQCGALQIADLVAIDTGKLPGFDAPGFRCKSLSVCGVSQNCIYYSETLGSVQSAESTYYDGHTLAAPEAVKISIAAGASSQCGDPSIDIASDEFLVVKTANGRVIQIAFPAFSGQSLLLYVREDGATFYDSGLTQRASPGG